jgi:hypothetical protein
MFTRSKHTAPGAIALLAAILSTAGPVSAQTSTVFDPVGDPPFHFNAPFQDIVRVQMTRTASGDFELLMELAGPVPVNPPLPPGRREIWWFWAIDLDPTTAPPGYPFQSNYARGPEFMVYVSWDGTEFAGTAIDRRPLLTGGEAIITDVPFSINGTIVEADLASTLIGAVPPSFNWFYATVDWRGPVGSEGYGWLDVSWTDHPLLVFNP